MADGRDGAGKPEGHARPVTSTKVRILDEEYTIRSDAPARHTREVAAHIDRAIRHLLASGAVVETHKAAILAALQVTDELFRARAAADGLTARARDLSADVARWLPPAKRGIRGEASADATGGEG